MKPLSIQQIRQITAGKALSQIPLEAPKIKAVCTDTRRMESSSLFVAIKGDNFDGTKFLPQAAAGGAVAALVESIPTNAQPNMYLLQVPNARYAMGKLATHVRKQMKAKVIAVGGSNGKTSTKNLIDAALHHKLRGTISPKSFNNDIGVPTTIFAADPTQDYLVLEMGTNHIGELKPLSDMAQPDIAVITNIAAEHLEGLGDLMGVRQEESSIISGLNPAGLLVVNGDDPDLLEAVTPYRGKRITFGFKRTNDLFATDIHTDENGTRFQLNGSVRTVFVPLLGKHTATNALAAIACARRLGLNEADIVESLATAHGPEMRLQLHTIGRVTILNDAYNANPASMKAALETLLDLTCTGRKIAILGDMRELGASSERYHKEMGQYVGAMNLDALYCVGPSAELIANEAKLAGFAGPIAHYDDSTTAATKIPAKLHAGDLVLLKGSRTIRLESIAQALASAAGSFLKVAG